MSTEWNEENIKEHLFTVVDVSDNGIDWARTKLEGFRSKATYPFVAEGSGWVRMRLIPKKTKRLMKPIELAGKWLDFGDDGMALIIGVDYNCVMTHSDTCGIESLNCNAHNCQGWRDTPTSKINTSFEVDE